VTSFVQWIGEKLGYRRTPDRADAALQMASDVVNSTRSLKEQLKPFIAEDDPFAAIRFRTRVSAEHENKVEFDQTPKAPT
jgi:hypothetical protein